MTEFEFDAMLRSALLEAKARQWAPVMEEGPKLVWSPRRQKMMDKILADPFGYGRRMARPLWLRALARAGQVAACFLLAGSLTYAAVPPARAWVHQAVQLVVEWLDTNTRFRFQGEAQGDLGHWRPAYLPEGYEEVSAEPFGNGIEVLYEDPQGNQIVFDYMPAEEGALYNFDNEHADYSEIEINGYPAQLFTSNTEGKPSYLVWSDEWGEIGYFLMADLPVEEFLKTAQSVVAQ